MVHTTAEDVVILAADKTLLKKLGNTKLDAVFGPQAIEKAQAAINSAAEGLYIECMSESVNLEVMAAQLEQASVAEVLGPKVKKLVSVAFKIKSKSAQSGYGLVATLAESLQKICESIVPEKVTPSVVKILIWHSRSISHLLMAKVKADGGAMGKAILAEVQKIKI
ncbi:MAG: hypothetical protein PHW76_05695 [Alphaproteobacteria bacterium]|nr:hypothetical protein [Alphaproteobacteria bacterium]